jgi:N-acetylglucosamine kinase-like BadF-type ATPase
MLQISVVVARVARVWTDEPPGINRQASRIAEKIVGSMSAASRTGVTVGIDAGGSSTRARAVDQGVVVHEGTGGPGNPIAADPSTLRTSYGTALAGCPPAARVVACVSGAGGAIERDQIHKLLAELLPGAQVQVRPDYVAAVAAAPEGTDVTIIAGTGSLICSRTAGGTFAVSGGRTWILGDHGSAARLGRTMLEWYCNDPDAAHGEFARPVAGAVGDSDWRQIVKLIRAAANPAVLLARAAPILTEAAQAGHPWATERLDAELALLATATLRHLDRHVQGRDPVRAALAGGVWTSSQAVSAFTAALTRLGPPCVLAAPSRLSPLDGAVRLAANLDS